MRTTKNRCVSIHLQAGLVFCLPRLASAGVSYTDPGSTYAQNFNSLPNASGTYTWSNDGTLTGWYAFPSQPDRQHHKCLPNNIWGAAGTMYLLLDWQRKPFVNHSVVGCTVIGNTFPREHRFVWNFQIQSVRLLPHV